MSEKQKAAQGRSALVTGANARIGRALALELASLGFDVAVHFHQDEAGAQHTMQLVRDLGRRAIAVGADLAKHEDIKLLFDHAGAQLGVLSCLVNNASIFERDTLATMNRQSWQEHISVNLEAPLFLAQTFAERLRAQGNISGAIVNIIDQRVLRLTPDFFSYTVSKAGLWAATQTMAQALSPHIRVNAIGPGPVLPSSRQTVENFARQTQSTPLGRAVGVEEIAGALRLIMQSPSMTGQLILLDSGQHLDWRLSATEQNGE